MLKNILLDKYSPLLQQPVVLLDLNFSWLITCPILKKKTPWVKQNVNHFIFSKVTWQQLKKGSAEKAITPINTKTDNGNTAAWGKE